MGSINSDFYDLRRNPAAGATDGCVHKHIDLVKDQQQSFSERRRTSRDIAGKNVVSESTPIRNVLGVGTLRKSKGGILVLVFIYQSVRG